MFGFVGPDECSCGACAEHGFDHSKTKEDNLRQAAARSERSAGHYLSVQKSVSGSGNEVRGRGFETGPSSMVRDLEKARRRVSRHSDCRRVDESARIGIDSRPRKSRRR